MKTSDNGINCIAHEESFVGHVYLDFAGVPTIGYGHALPKTAASLSLPPISESEARALLRQDVHVAEARVERDVKVPMTQNEYDALVSFTFNCGGGALDESTILRLLNAEDRHGAAQAFLMWDKAEIHGKMQVSETLLARRTREMNLFLLADAEAPAPVDGPAPPDMTDATLSEIAAA